MRRCLSVAAVAVALLVVSPASAQCPGGVCTPARTVAPVRNTVRAVVRVRPVRRVAVRWNQWRPVRRLLRIRCCR